MSKYSFRSKLILSCIAVTIIGSLSVYAQDVPALAGLFSDRQIIVSGPTPTTTPRQISWTISQKIKEGYNLIKDMKPAVGNTQISYTETRFNGSSTTKTFKEPEKQIVLAVLDKTSGEVKVVTITKRGGELIAPPGWSIEVLQRPSGIRWNVWNTAYRINKPTEHVVIGNLYPDEKDTRIAKKKNGRTTYTTQRTIDYRFYVPYSPDLHTQELVELGRSYVQNMVRQAIAELRLAGVQSRAVEGKLVSDLFESRSDYFARIPLLEQTDMTEFQIDPRNTVERALVLVAANQEKAFSLICNSSSACGWVQFTPGTYKTIAKSYPAAKLTPDFYAGAADHLNSMKAAVLLYDENLKGLIAKHGDKVINDPKLEEYLASSYNGAPRHVHKTLSAAIIGGIQDWIHALTPKTGGLRTETLGYMVKLRWLKQNQNFSVAASS